ncbi:MAG: hypothetical protein HGB12_12840 [Bacteroidetes bacterium]|nr:hypothetical protein [Bacteroidota bacterium]
MLLASGVKIEHSGKIIPIIIDVDAENADTARTIKGLKLYKDIRAKAIEKDEENYDVFFGTNLDTLSSQRENDSERIKDDFQLNVVNLSKTFAEYFKVNEMDVVDEHFMRLLYDSSQKNDKNCELNLELVKGFKGNPNIGCMIFNELENIPDFRYFMNAFADGDRIFIISSIFGGTGSAGFPQLLKILKKKGNNKVSSAIKGAITIMPYFSIEENGISAIDSNLFMSKTKSALAYYEKEMDGIDSMYYIYDKPGSKLYKNNEGGSSQQNNAHIVEFIAATSVIDFTNKDNTEFTGNTKYYEYGIKKDVPGLDIRHFYDKTKNKILKPLASFAYASKTYLDFIPKNLDEAFAKELNLKNEIQAKDFYLKLSDFIGNYYFPWLDEMEQNDRSFKPFNLRGDFNSFMVGKRIETGLIKKGINNNYIKKHIGIIENKLQGSIVEKEIRFMTMLNELSKKYFEQLSDLPTMS